MSDVILKTEDLRVEFRCKELGHDTKLAINGLNLSSFDGRLMSVYAAVMP